LSNEAESNKFPSQGTTLLSPDCSNIGLSQTEIQNAIDFPGTETAIMEYWNNQCDSEGKQPQVDHFAMIFKGSGIFGAK